MCLGSPVAYGEFGIKDVALYRKYLEYFLSESVLRTKRLQLKDAGGAVASDYCCCGVVCGSAVVDSAGVVRVCGPGGQYRDDSGRVVAVIAGGTGGGVGRVYGRALGAGGAGAVGVAVCGTSDVAPADGGSGGSTTDSAGTGGSFPAVVANVRGRNYARNKARREKRKGFKLVSSDKREPFKEDGVEPEGFWNSCTEEMRRELIESKARMHVAENRKRETKAKKEVERMESPEDMLVKAMGMINMAKEFADKKQDSRVAGWAETVATSYAESIAKSAPSSVPSYASVAAGSAATSVSVDGTKRAKPVAPVVKEKVSTDEVSEKNLTVNQVIGRIGNRIAAATTDEQYQQIMDEVLDNKRINGFHTNRIVTLVLEKREALRVRNEKRGVVSK